MVEVQSILGQAFATVASIVYSALPSTYNFQFACPETPGTLNFTIPNSDGAVIALHQTNQFCTLVKEGEAGARIPVARTYDTQGWERAGGGFASRLDEWECMDDDSYCQAWLPQGRYVLQTRGISQEDSSPTVQVARFLESASFGATPDDLSNWGDEKSFAQYISEQILDVHPTYHREFFRRRVNPIWHFNKPEFGANLNPCNARSTWRRHMLSIEDMQKVLTVKRTKSGLWKVEINGILRTVTPNLRLRHTDELQLQENEQYPFCSRPEQIRRGIIKLKIKHACREMVADDFLIDFPEGFQPAHSLSTTLPALASSESWLDTSHNNLPEYMLKTGMAPDSCAGLPFDDPRGGPPIFVRTEAGEWLQHDPRAILEENTVDSPIADGGTSAWAANRTRYCSNVRRNFQNEAFCKFSDTVTCRPFGKHYSETDSTPAGGIVCGSPGEVANEPSLGDFWLDMHGINSRGRSIEYNLPRDKFGPDRLQRQRVFVWNEIALKAPDQLRQRMAWALFQIFALPQSEIKSEKISSEIFMVYYDIFVRNAFGNYRDILREVTYNPLMGASLSYLESRSVGSVYAANTRYSYPDENYSRELMQLFTIGLIELNTDGTPVLNADNKTIRTYDSDDIMSFARIWTGFTHSPKRANVEGFDKNRADPLRIYPEHRDRFPKTDLSRDGFIGDGYPLCVDLPDKPFLRIGARYRLLGRSPVPELHYDDKLWVTKPNTKRLRLEANGSGLYEKLSQTSGKYPVLVELDKNLACPGNATALPVECLVDTVRVVQVEEMFYEYVKLPCVELAFFDNGIMASGRDKQLQSVCVNPYLISGSEACCDPSIPLFRADGEPACAYSGERMKFSTAQERCSATGKSLRRYRKINVNEWCAHIGYHWTDQSCQLKVKVNKKGEVAIVHDLENPIRYVGRDTPSFFRVYWQNGQFPTPAKNCGGNCEEYEDSCVCYIGVSEEKVFATPPAGASEVLGHLRVGHVGTNLYNDGVYKIQETNDYRYHSPSGDCCDEYTVFEVTDHNGRLVFLRNMKSVVEISGSNYSFRNPPHFNSVVPTEFSVIDAEYENEALLDHLFYHQNTAPFVAYRLIQRFGDSNPSPRYVRAVATAFRNGIYTTDTVTFGSGKYGDLAATVAATLLDREARAIALANDPFRGVLKEPILKVLGFMRGMKFESSVPLIELDFMHSKVGQMVYAQPTVFSYFRPEYSPSGIASAAELVSPEEEVMSAGKVIGLLNGLLALIDTGLGECEHGFGWFGCNETSSGVISYEPAVDQDRTTDINDLSTLLTGGRLGEGKRGVVLQAIENVPDPKKAWQLALKLILTTPEFHSTSKVDATPNMALPEYEYDIKNDKVEGYKAVIHIALFGGADSFNMLVPHPTCTELSKEYKDIRYKVALDDDQLLTIEGDTTGQPCQSFGLHNKLPLLKELYDQQDLLFLANVGVLTQPCNKTNYNERTLTQLFAHNAMQSEVDVLDPKNLAGGTGALGRLADSLIESGYRTSRTAVEVSPRNLAGRLETVSPVFALDQSGIVPLDGNLTSPGMSSVINELNSGASERSGVFGEIWSSTLHRSLNHTDKVFYILQSSTPTTSNFSESNLGQRFRLISQLIATRKERKVDRDFFKLRFEGWDMHGEAVETLSDKFAALEANLRDMVNELKLMGVWDDTVIIQTSDFGRTLSPNSGGGTDHGWGGNYWIMGGGVKGQRILGKYPASLSPLGELILDRGRIVPTTSWEAPFNGLAEWMGVNSENELKTILPNRDSFVNLLRANDLFVQK